MKELKRYFLHTTTISSSSSSSSSPRNDGDEVWKLEKDLKNIKPTLEQSTKTIKNEDPFRQPLFPICLHVMQSNNSSFTILSLLFSSFPSMNFICRKEHERMMKYFFLKYKITSPKTVDLYRCAVRTWGRRKKSTKPSIDVNIN